MSRRHWGLFRRKQGCRRQGGAWPRDSAFLGDSHVCINRDTRIPEREISLASAALSRRVDRAETAAFTWGEDLVDAVIVLQAPRVGGPRQAGLEVRCAADVGHLKNLFSRAGWHREGERSPDGGKRC